MEWIMKLDKETYFKISDMIETALTKGGLDINRKVRVMVEELNLLYGVDVMGLKWLITDHYDDKDLHSKWKGKSKLATYINSIVFYYLSNDLKKRRHWKDRTRIERKPKDVMDTNRDKIERFVDADSEDDVYYDLKEWQLYHTDNPEEEYIKKETQMIADEVFDELDWQVIYGETTMSGAAKSVGLSYNAYYKRLNRKKNIIY